jgi:hypothetical protein
MRRPGSIQRPEKKRNVCGKPGRSLPATVKPALGAVWRKSAFRPFCLLEPAFPPTTLPRHAAPSANLAICYMPVNIDDYRGFSVTSIRYVTVAIRHKQFLCRDFSRQTQTTATPLQRGIDINLPGFSFAT